jgi:hypothetical protein
MDEPVKDPIRLKAEKLALEIADDDKILVHFTDYAWDGENEIPYTDHKIDWKALADRLEKILREKEAT